MRGAGGGPSRRGEKRSRLLIGEDAEAGELELEQRVLRSVQVGRDDVLRPVDQPVEHVAAACGQDQQRVLGAEPQELLVDARVLPRDVVCEAHAQACRQR
jgi:hypothetical protein